MKIIRKLIAIVFVCLFALSFTLTSYAIEQGQGVVKIFRDNYGVPHIYAKTAKDLFTGWGYVVAKDRLFQLEVIRASIWGRVAGLYGPGQNNKYIEFDKATRQNGYTVQEIWQQVNALEKKYQIMLESYANGINLYIQEALANPTEKLPYEFHQNGISTIERWTAADVAQIFINFSGMRFSDSSSELSNAALLDFLVKKYGAEAGAAAFDDVLPLNATDSPATCPAEEVTSKKERKRISKTMIDSIPSGVREVEEKERARNELIISVLNDLGIASKAGSQMWSVGGQKTEDKTTILFGGPQNGFFVPSYQHEVGLHGAGFDIVGHANVGYPVTYFGHNNNIAWSATAGVGNYVDIFILKLVGDPYHYIHNGKVLEMKKRTETINVKNGAPVTVDVYKSIYGPLISWGEGIAYTKKRIWEGMGAETLSGWIDCTEARNFSQFTKGASKISFSVNMGYADKMGNIGFIHNGRYAIRHPDTDVRLPTPGTGEYDWIGYHPFSWNPKCENPKQGFLANWNSRPSADYPGGDRVWGSYNRVYRIFQDLKSKEKFTVEDMKWMNSHIGFIHLDADYFSPYFLENIGSDLDPQLSEAIARLRGWDKSKVDENSDGYYDAPGLTIWDQWWSEVLKATLQDELGSYYKDANLLLHVLQGENSIIRLSRDYLNGVPVGTMLKETLRTALSALQAKFGTSNMDLWLTPKREHVFNTNSTLGIPQTALAVRNLRLEMNRGNANHIVILGKGDVAGIDVNPPGQSGFVRKDGTRSPHYVDQLDMYEDFRGYKPMLHKKEDVLKNLESTEYIVVP